MTRYQAYQLSAFVLVGISASQLIATFGAIFNWQVGLAIFIPVLLGQIGWVCLEAAKILRSQESPVSALAPDEQPPESNLPFAILALVLTVVGGLMGVLWTDD